MAVEDDNAALDVPETPEIPSEDSYRDADLSRVFQEAAPEFTAPDEPDPPAPEPAPEPEPEPNPQLEALHDELRQLRESQQEGKIQNDILRNQLISRQQPQAPAPVPAEDDDEETLLNSLREGITKDPAAAILKTIKTLTKGQKGASDAAIASAQRAAVELIERKQNYDADRATAVAEYGDLFNNNPSFGKLAAQIYDRITVDAQEIQPGVKWRTGAMYLAASTAYAQMAKAGQLNTAPSKVVNLRERKPAPTNPLLGQTSESSQPKIGDGISPTDLSRMRASAARLGVPFEKYVKTFKDMTKSDPNFGRG